jgi:DNA-directed RNA polymerase specialized sigma24 family protein
VSLATAGPLAGDEVLWQRVADRDAEAFGELFDRHAGAVYSYLSMRLGDWSAAEDLTSAVFLQAWRRRAEIAGSRLVICAEVAS